MQRPLSIRTLILITVAALLTGGCTMLGPDFVAPEAPVTEGWIDQMNTALKPDGEDPSDWWRDFDDPVLNDLIRSAYEQNLTLQIAGLRVLEARAQLGLAAGNLYPQSQQAFADYSKSQLSKNQTSLPDRTFDQASVGFDAAWELDFWGRFRRGVESADANLLANIAAYDDVLVILTAEVARSYILIRTLEERLSLARENVAIQQESLRIATVRFDNGAVTELDVAQAKSLLNNTQALIPRLETLLRRTTNALSILLGKPPGDLDSLLAASRGIPAPPQQVAVGVPAELLRRRPDIRQAEGQAVAQCARIGIARADLFPSFTLFGTIGLASASTGNNSLGDLFDGDSLTFDAGAGIRWNLFNYGRLKNRVRIEDARFQQLLVNYQNVVLLAAQEVEDALVGFLRTREEVDYLRASVEAAKRASTLAMIQYREGAIDYQRVLDSDRFLSEQQDSLTATEGDIVLNLVAMYKALGGGWQLRLGDDFVPMEMQQEMGKRTDWGNLLKTGEQRSWWRAPDW